MSNSTNKGKKNLNIKEKGWGFPDALMSLLHYLLLLY